MNEVFDILSLGEILLRLSPTYNERIASNDGFDKRCGGAELNVLSGASLMGLKTGIISKLPRNDIGLYAKNRIRFFSISDDYLVYDDEKDARLGVYYYENGAYPRKPKIVYDRNHTSFQKINVNEFPESMYKNAICFHVSGITLALNKNCEETAVEMIKKFKENGTIISFDVNFRGNLWTGEEAKATIEKILPYIDVFFCSESTAKLTFGKTGTLEEIMKSFTDDYPITVVASTQRTVHSPKVHSFTSTIYNSKLKKYYRSKEYKHIEVVDRIGSGDAYISGALYGLIKYNFDCQKAVEFGNATSAMKNTIPGDMQASTLDEIVSLIRDHNSDGEGSEMER